MDIRVGGATVRVVDWDMDPTIAVIIVVPVDPVDNDVASPLKLEALLMAATDWLDEFHVTVAVKSSVDESE